MKEATSIILHSESVAAVNCLTDEQAGILFKAILEYAYSEKVWESKDTALQALFSMFKTQIDRDWKRYKERCEKNRVNALKRHAKGGEPMPREPVASDGNQSQANETNNNSNNNANNNNNDEQANAIIINNESDVSFDTIWEMYGRPIGEKSFIKAMWDELPPEDHMAILKYLPCYIANTPDVKYRKYFNNFLSERYWETHPLNTNQNGIINYPRINEQTKRKRDVLNTATKVINGFESASE